MHKGSLGGMASVSDREKFERAIKSVKAQGAIITTHEVPDADGLGSAFTIARKLRGMGKAAEIVCGPLTPPVEPLVDRLGLEVKGWGQVPQSDLRPVIVVDTSNPALLGGLCGRENRIILLIDHHQRNEETVRAAERIENVSAISACEIIASLLRRKDVDKMSALALAVGIASDSERLNYADLRTLRIFEKLLTISGAGKREIDELAYPPMRPDMLASVMEDMRSLRVELYRGRVIAAGQTALGVPSIFADAIRGMGASVSAGVSELEDSWVRLSIRVRLREAYDKGIHASRIANRASELCHIPKNLRGGGHIDKAGALIRATAAEVIEAVIASAKEAIDAAESEK